MWGQIAGRSMAAGRLISCAEGNVEGHHAVIDDVLFPAEQVRACFPPPSQADNMQVSESAGLAEQVPAATAANKGGRPAIFRWDEIIDQFLVDSGRLSTQDELIALIGEAAARAGLGAPSAPSILYHFTRTYPNFLASVSQKCDFNPQSSCGLYDGGQWNKIVDHFMIRIGAPDTQAELVRRVQRAAIETKQEEPDSRTIRGYFSKHFPKFLIESKSGAHG